MKIFKKTFWKRLWRILQEKRAELNVEVFATDRKNADSGNAPHYREITIDKVLYRLTSIFEGSKDIDKTIERLAVQNAVNQENQV